jgi:hypothetical protein
MGYRRSNEKVRAARDWNSFVAKNIETIRTAGLPELVTTSIRHWDEFLIHGYLDHHEDPSRFTVDELSEEEYSALVKLVESYFMCGYEYFTPIALRSVDQQILDHRFGKR